ncbi:MAG TPA: PQQ-binding-like beta-propeller repeat protein [Solirubrobacteraceae bacterium]|nr:PQQ-binding-like beta-propeller repeat protein [Solirubrobacteraceae bacterium]
MPSPGSRRGLVAVAGLLLAIGVAVVVLVGCGSTHHPHTVARVAPAPKPAATPPAPKPRPAPTDDPWPFYGYNLVRTRFFPGGAKLDPPLRVGWTFHDGALLEFPPVIYDNTLYFEDANGWASALSTTNDHLLWHVRVGTLAAASPALDIQHKLVFFTLLSRTPGSHTPGNGAVVALSMSTGKVAWSRALPPGSESSPLVHGLSVFLGDQDGTVYSLRTYDGHLNWTFQASGAVKGGVAFAHNTVYFGDYGAHVYAVNAATGREVWATGGSGTFYSTPAVAFGRVYIGSTSGTVYAFWANSGSTAWTASTGAYVYASPAVTDVPGLGPTVYIGSYDGHLYAYNATDGAVRWSHPAGGRIDGSATIVGNVVYYADLGLNKTTGLNWRTGQPVFSFPDGEFTPVITDGKVVFLIGYSTIYQMVPGS